ncbi:glycoside hydrolase family 130 protein [Coraliomargarita algicola]|uniref:Glycoside hydrolase family 130 protein n=1 Tax=Coraliomargarita algicola TaxID=3092156 RepID=A0ABZ0RI59_9BACT|nr:glycoside hydrolase family 130 protein [Coraliomargarita sp. J2-16]WPJ95056.1 glycoside hydrolase family 130 protein [Coraliomargarita sp. J2-16]
MLIQKYSGNPILRAEQVPYPAGCVFNAGVTKLNGEYLMLFRNDYDYISGATFGGTNLGLARSSNGVDWIFDPEPAITAEQAREAFRHSHAERYGLEEIGRIYDPRISVIDGLICVCTAMDTKHGVIGAMLTTEDFKSFELMSISTPDNRNMVLFPEKINDHYYRLERPFPVYGRGGGEAFDIWSSCSPDLKFWGDSRLVLGSEEVPYSNCKIGPAAPPIRTQAGWLTTIHAVYKDESRPLKAWGDQVWNKAYYAGLMLLDINDPQKVIGLAREPLLSPDTSYEIDGFRGEVIFPGGMILEDDGEVKIYYGAADTSVALATAHVDNLLALCKPL